MLIIFLITYILLMMNLLNFNLQKKYWGGSDIEYNYYTYDDFISTYEYDTLKN